MKEQTYSQNIANAINEFLKNNDWLFSFDEKRGVFEFGLSIIAGLREYIILFASVIMNTLCI